MTPESSISLFCIGLIVATAWKRKCLRAFSHRGGGPREGGSPPWWGKSIYPYNLSFFSWSHSNVRWGTPCTKAGYSVSGLSRKPSSMGWVFSMWKLRSWVTRLTGVIKSLERGELFRRLHLHNRQNADEIDCAGDNISVQSDSQAANQWNQTKFCLQQRHWSEKQLHRNKR